jgi:hypothetical protein
MLLVLRPETTEEEHAEVMRELGELGLEGRLLKSETKPLVHVLNGPTRPARRLVRLPQVEGIVPTSGPRIRRFGRRFYPYHFIGWSAVGLLLAGLLVLLAGYLPPGLGVPPDLRNEPDVIERPWYLWAVDSYLEMVPGIPGIALLLFFVAAVFFLPLLDRTKGEGLRARLPVLVPGMALVALYVLLTVLGGTS